LNVKYTAENIMCYPIDKAKLSEYLNNVIHERHPDDDMNYEVVHDRAIVIKPRPGWLTEEFVGGEGKYRISAHEKMEIGKWCSCAPIYEFEFNFADITPFLKKQITLAEFTKERRGYNSRIRCNEAEWMRYFNKEES